MGWMSLYAARPVGDSERERVRGDANNDLPSSDRSLRSPFVPSRAVSISRVSSRRGSRKRPKMSGAAADVLHAGPLWIDCDKLCLVVRCLLGGGDFGGDDNQRERGKRIMMLRSRVVRRDRGDDGEREKTQFAKRGTK